MKDLISVVVPFKNHRAYIESSFKSLQQQTFQNFELLFVNNGSNDGSDELAFNLTTSNPGKVKLFNEPRPGIPFARNKGLNEATGEFISFLDIDDRFKPEKLATLYKLLLRFPEAAMAFGQTQRIYVNENRSVIQDTGVAKTGINFPPELAIDWTKSFYRLPQTGATLARTSLARAVGGFPENLLMGNDDVGYHINIALNYPVVYEPFVAVEYFRHEQSEGARLNKSSNVHARYFDAHLKITEPAGKKYYQLTQDMTLWGLAQRSLFNNYTEAFLKNKLSEHIPDLNHELFPMYRILLKFYHMLPYKAARVIYKIIRRPFFKINPLKYPLN